MATIHGSVGRGGKNFPDDCKIVQTLLNKHLSTMPSVGELTVDGVVGPRTIGAIVEFQKYYMQLAKPDGLVDVGGATLTRLSEKDVKTAYGTTIEPVVTGKALPEPALRVLLEIMRESNNAEARVTSVTRTAADQARIMYEAIQLYGVQYSFDLYSGPGDKVTQIYVDNQAKPRDQVIGLMEEKIKEIGPAKVSLHCSESHHVFDVAPSSVAHGSSFLKAARHHPKVSRVLDPDSKPKDVAYHIEIPKSRL